MAKTLFSNVFTSNKKHFKEMNSYVGMTMVKKEQGQDDYFNQQSILNFMLIFGYRLQLWQYMH